MESYVITHICDNLNEIMERTDDISDARYHHNASYKDSILICKHGILSLRELNERGIRHDSKETLKKLSDIESHPNGIDSISLSIDDPNGRSELQTYDYRRPDSVDFRVSSQVPAYRSSFNYDNELICREFIDLSKIKAIDVRMRKLCDIISTAKNLESRGLSERMVIDNYNYLIDLAKVLVRKKLNIPLRELSDEENGIYSINIQRLSEKTKLK